MSQADCPQRTTRQSLSVPVVEPGRKECIFCQKFQLGKKHKYQKTSQCQSHNAAQKVLDAAKLRKDEAIVIAIGSLSCLIAREVHYHRHCFREYTRLLEVEDPGDDPQGIGGQAPSEEQVVAQFLEVVRQELFDNSALLTSSDLQSIFQTCCNKESGNFCTQVRNRKLKSIILKEFDGVVRFVRPARCNAPELLYAVSSTDNLIRQFALLKEEVAEDEPLVPADPYCSESGDESEDESAKVESRHVWTNECEEWRVLYHAANILRQSIEHHVKSTKQDLSGAQLSPADSARLIPHKLFNFLAWTLDKDAEFSTCRLPSLESVLQRRIHAICQDLMFCGTGYRTPKHIVLGMAIHHLCRSKQIVTMLNRLGYCCSYSQVLELETCLAEAFTRHQHDQSFLPAAIDTRKPYHFVWDNNDLCEETLSGLATTHCTNGIVVQPSLQDESVASEATSISLPTLSTSKRKRSLAMVPEIQPVFAMPARQNPPPTSLPESSYAYAADTRSGAALMDFVWKLSRFCPDGQISKPRAVIEIGAAADGKSQSIPAWTAFNSLATKNNVPSKSEIGYCPVINASPTENLTVYTLLCRSITMARQADLPFTMVVLDQAIYAKAVDIVLQRPQEFRSVVLRMGSFHITMTLLAIIGKRFTDAGLLDLLVEAQVSGSATASLALAGKHYNRGVRFHKCVAEAMERLRWRSFIDSTADADLAKVMSQNVVDGIVELRNHISDDNVSRLVDSSEVKTLHKMYAEFCSQQSDASPMFKYWSSYLSMVSLLLDFIRSVRTANWQLHMSCIRAILPWCFAYDRHNYSRFMAYYWLKMLKLPETHPDAAKYLEDGGFAVQRGNNAFAQVASDMAIEQTINRSSKTTGGIIGISRSPSAVQRWIVTSHDRARISDVCMEHCGLDESTQQGEALHTECQQTRMARDEADVQQIESTVCGWVNPFSTTPAGSSEDLVGLSSGLSCSNDAKQDLFEAEVRGEAAFRNFVEERLVLQNKKFLDPLPKLKLKTFAIQKQKASSQSKSIPVLRADCALFSKMAVIAQSRHMDVRQVLSYPLGSAPLSLCTPDGTLAKTNKSALLQLLEKVSPSASLPETAPAESSALIVDAMAMLQALSQKSIPATFSELASFIFKSLSHNFRQYKRVDFVVDSYPDLSIKNIERDRRAATREQVRQHISSGLQQTPAQWSKFLSVSQNKTELISFFMAEWCISTYAADLCGRELFVTAGDLCTKLSSTVGSGMIKADCIELKCTHEEADTRLLLHGKHAADNGYTSITIKSPDTDVAVLACCLSASFPEQANLYFLTGSRSNVRLLDMKAIGSQLEQSACTCSALLGMHAFTGCDTVSAFHGRGKAAAFSLIRADGEKGSRARAAMSSLGQTFKISSSHVPPIEQFTCLLYECGVADINDARYQLFSSAETSKDSSRLPPCRDALLKHIARANYQAAVWRRALEPQPDIPPPFSDGQGWKLVDGKLQVDWLSLEPAPKALLEFVKCSCKTGCSGGRCSCKAQSLHCTDVCGCAESCQNRDNALSDDT